MEKTRIFSTLGAKTRILVFNIASGLLSLAGISYIFYSSLTYDYNAFFTQYNQSILYLEKIRRVTKTQQYYFHQKTQEELLIIYNEVHNLWNKYANLQSDLMDQNKIAKLTLGIYEHLVGIDRNLENLEIIENSQQNFYVLESQINKFLIELDRIANGGFNYDRLNDIIDLLDEQIYLSIDSTLQLIEIRHNRSSYVYDALHKIVLVIMCLIMILTLMLSFLILRNIKSLHNALEIKVAEKTKELQRLNESLKEMVEKEVLDSRKKDQIMYQQSRLASMGEMIGNIAHQWRQPLNALTLLIQTFKVKVNNGKLTKEFVESQVEEGLKIAKNMSRTIDDFRGFFYASYQKERFNLKSSIHESVSLISAFLKQKEIDLQVICDDNIEIYGYKSAFSQVVLNFIKNSEDVFSERDIKNSHIRIMAKLDKSDVLVGEDIECVKISFIDNGGGIRLDDINKVFEPYFTTKHKSVGTGIGLYMSKQIIEKQMHGIIEVRNVNWVEDFDFESIACGISIPLDFVNGAEFIVTIPLKSE